MPRFKYTARTPEGKIESGTVDAASSEAVVVILQNRKLIITSLVPETAENQIRFLNFLSVILGRVKTQDVVVLTRQLAALISAKVPLVQSLRTMAKQTKNKNLSGIVSAVADDVDAGASLSRSLVKYPRVFSSFYVNMVKSGEVSGRLEEVLVYLADYLGRQYLLTARARSAMIYPLFVLGSLVIIGILLLVVVVPQLTTIVVESGAELPAVTRLLIALSNFTRAWGWLLAIVFIVAGVFSWRYVKKSAEGRYIFDSIIIRVPVFGELMKKIYMARFAETLSTLSSAGIAISQALEVTADIIGNSVYRLIVLEANEEVRRGGSISTALERHKEILPMVVQMVSVGEQTGKLDVILRDVAKFFTEEVGRTLDTLVQLIEPILILILGAGTAILVAAILLPIYNLAESF
ncbi:hypothetical protein A3I30_00225 [Candidatus Azambacteria bacterium RIFCSPLOWO2_02_FULL_44_14]|uniref:Type II secretion system protein GspF domain-containing protein n=1 Tax=Candidatus Azambacteria bacterium RIFCSPLOWO2_02_FULL_44_14 TaxID=1797306 RepID=A0A1F5CAY3_9BACT|nr:MAG: hypothetical protein A3I30_00225 [Candidatus Azambacteria bacterium RIFCSPLOWO2_02_FULL_44_14]